MRITAACEKPPDAGFSRSPASGSQRGLRCRHDPRRLRRGGDRGGDALQLLRDQGGDRRHGRRRGPGRGPRRLRRQTRRGDSLEEELFALVAAELRALRPHRNYLGPVLETALGPIADRRGDVGEAMRRDHMGVVGRLLEDHGRPGPIDPGSAHLYWTLYVGVLSFWAHDASPNQEDTLAVLDQSLRAFVSILPPKVGGAGPVRSRGAA